MKTVLEIAKELNMGDATYLEFMDVVRTNPEQLGKVYANFFAHLLKTSDTITLESVINNAAYLVEQYSDVEPEKLSLQEAEKIVAELHKQGLA